jgi:catechol 2,3-dioxygenase-like lactoylglutathione lyase family enzyme
MTSTDSTPAPAGTPLLGPITHVALTVRDLSTSVPFYRALTGSDPVLDEDTGPFRHVVFALGSTLLGLHQFPEGETAAEGFSPRRPGLDHIAFAATDRAELDAWVRRLDAEGVEHGEVVDAHYGSGVAVKDPDGVALEVFCPPSS